METIAAIQAEIVEEFDMFENWMEKYEYIIELGKTLPIIDEKYKLDENLIKGLVRVEFGFIPLRHATGDR